MTLLVALHRCIGSPYLRAQKEQMEGPGFDIILLPVDSYT